MSEGVKRKASAVVFADADGEYPPEELQNLVEPILTGHADYVVGSRFQEISNSCGRTDVSGILC